MGVRLQLIIDRAVSKRLRSACMSAHRVCSRPAAGVRLKLFIDRINCLQVDRHLHSACPCCVSADQSPQQAGCERHAEACQPQG